MLGHRRYPFLWTRFSGMFSRLRKNTRLSRLGGGCVQVYRPHPISPPFLAKPGKHWYSKIFCYFSWQRVLRRNCNTASELGGDFLGKGGGGEVWSLNPKQHRSFNKINEAERFQLTADRIGAGQAA